MPFLHSLRQRFAESPANKALAVDERKEVVLERYYSALAAAGVSLTPNGPKPWTIQRAIAEGYQRVVWVFKAVEAIAGNAASRKVPFEVVDGEHVIEDHPLSRVMNEMANPIETGKVFRKRLSAQVLLSPRGAFVEVTENRVGDVMRLDLLPPGRTRPVPGTGSTLIDHYEVVGLDGTVRQTVPVERVRWVREPHPIDLYGAVTPLEAAGLSIELNYFARLYNSKFMQNDGRPGGVLGVESDMLDEEMERIEAKFGRGPLDAGKVTVLGGGVSYVDMARTPRDGQYVQTSQISRDEILVAFGTPESVIGNSSNRTFSNADADGEYFWTITMEPHLDTVASAFISDCHGLMPRHNLDAIEQLNRPARDTRAEARAEFEAGLRSIYSYAQVAGIEGIEDTPQTRALWLPSGRTAIAAQDGDAEALAPPPPQGSQPGGPVTPSTEMAPGSSEPLAAAPTGQKPHAVPAPVSPAPRALAAAPVVSTPTSAPVEPVVASPASPDEGKDLIAQIVAEDALRERLQATLAGSLTALVERQTEVTVARLASPKVRSHTRHWRPEHAEDKRVGNAPLDVERVVDPQRWCSEAARVTFPLLRGAAVDAAEDLEYSIDADAWADASAQRIARYAARHAGVLTETITVSDEAGIDLAGIVDNVRHSDTAKWIDDAAESIAGDLLDDTRAGAVEAKAVEDEQRDPVETQVEAALLAVAATQGAQAAQAATDGVADPVDPQAYGAATTSALRPILLAAAVAAAMQAGGSDSNFTAEDATLLVLDGVESVLAMMAASAVRQAEQLREVLRQISVAADAKAQVREFIAAQGEWASGLAIQAATAAIEGAKDEVAIAFGGLVKTWVTRHDSRVRPTHRAAEGQRRPPGEPFVVGGALLRFPGDVEGPFSETAGCRCRVRLEVTEGKHLPGRHRQGDHGNRYGHGVGGRNLLRRGRSLDPGRLDSAYAGPDIPLPTGPTNDASGEATVNGTPVGDYVGENAPYLKAWLAEDKDWMREWYAERTPGEAQIATEMFTKWSDDLDSWETSWSAAPIPQQRPGRKVNPEKKLREEYELFVDVQYVDALESTSGNLLSAEGQAAGGSVDDYSVFTGKLNVRHVSEELLRYWQDHPRLTFQQFRTQAWRRPSDMAGAEATSSRMGNIDTVRRVVMKSAPEASVHVSGEGNDAG